MYITFSEIIKLDPSIHLQNNVELFIFIGTLIVIFFFTYPEYLVLILGARAITN